MNNFIRLFLGGLFFAPLFWACGGGGNGSAPAPIRLDNKDAVTQQILSLRGKKNIDALLTYLQVENPKHRYTAALVLSAMQDSSANTLAALSKALHDPQPEVRELAAYALGQTRSLAAANILTQAFREDSAKQVQAQILEAIGYCGNEEQLKYLASAQPYPLADTQLLKGQALAIYRYALRGIIHPDGTAKMVKDFIANPLVASSARLVAANYLARAAKKTPIR
jgi:HEAT repeat protein